MAGINTREFSFPRFLLVLSLPASVWSLDVKSKLDTMNPWKYISTFAFRSTPKSVRQEVHKYYRIGDRNESLQNKMHKHGVYEYSVTITADDGIPLLLIHSCYNTWLKTYSLRDSSSCYQKVMGADIAINLLQNSSFDKGNFANYYDPLQKKATGVIIFENNPAQWAFTALANCDMDKSCKISYPGRFCQGSLSLSFHLVLTNGDSQFSYHQQGIIWCTLFVLLVQIGIVCQALYVQRSLARLQKNHLTVKMLVCSIIMHCVGLIWLLGYWVQYAIAGSAWSGCKLFGIFCIAMSDLTVILLCILISKGLTIVRKEISPNGITKIIAYITFLFIATVYAKVFEIYGNNDVTLLTLYQTGPGILLLVLRSGFALCWFIYAGTTTLRNYYSKRRFYRKFILLFSCWLFAPVPFALISLAIPLLRRTLFVFSWEIELTTVAHIILINMYTPSVKYNQGFPFHATTDYIGSTSHLFYRVRSLPAAEGFDSDARAGGTVGALPADADRVEHSSRVSVSPRPTVAQIYGDIRQCSTQVSRSARELSQVARVFERALSDWDVEDDEELDLDYE